MSDEEFETRLQELADSLRCLRRITDRGRRRFMMHEVRQQFMELTKI